MRSLQCRKRSKLKQQNKSKQQETEWMQELRRKANPRWLELMGNPGGIALLIKELPATLAPERVATLGTDERKVWELIGFFYRSKNQLYDAIEIYLSMYYHFLRLQDSSGVRVHKGMPLLWLADCYFFLGFATLSTRYLMLTLVEDAITFKGKVDPIKTGSYARLAWQHGLTDKKIKQYSELIYKIAENQLTESMFPEWILQELDQDWVIEIPNPNEAMHYISNEIYVKHLIAGLGEPTGKTLEKLIEYLLLCMPGCKTSRRYRSQSTDYDVVCSLQGPDIDFRSELGRYFVVECKDWKEPVDFSTFAKFCRVLDSVKCKFGIIVSKHGITGEGHNSDAEREQQKVFQDRGMVIIVVNQTDLDDVADGGNFIALLRNKYEKVRLDLRPSETAHHIYSAIVQAVKSGLLKEPFTQADFRKACPSCGEGTYKAFLHKHRQGNLGGESELFELVQRGRFCLLRPFRYDL